MKRKRAARKKLAAKKPTPSVNGDGQVFKYFVGQNAHENSPAVEIYKSNNYKNQSDQANARKNSSFSSSSSSSSSDNEGSFNLEIDSSGPDEAAPVTKKKRSVSKHGWPKKGEASRQPMNSSVIPPRGLVSNVNSSRGSGSKVMPSKIIPPMVREFSSLSRKRLPSLDELSQDPRYNKLELRTSLAVIKKVMKMDEAVPFNAPVDPVAQGLHDYFKVIDTPMDFGTICSNLQNGVKYMNSDDVYKDVNYIWENCRNYNKKGDYIVYLMKRIKKKFMNYWESAGLRTEIMTDNGGTGNSHSKPSSDHGMWQSRHEALSVVNRMVTNSNRMQQDKLGARQPQPHKPQPSTIQVPPFSQFFAGEGSNYTDTTRSRARVTGGGNKVRDSGGNTTPRTSVRAGIAVGASMVDGLGPSAPISLTPNSSQTSQGPHTPQPSPQSSQLPSIFRRAEQVAPPEPEPEPEPESESESEPEPEREPALAEDEDVNFARGGRTELTLCGDVMLPSDKCSRSIRKIMEKKLDLDGAKWKTVSQETKKYYFQEFKKQYFWDEAIDDMVKHAWQKKAGKRYSDMLSEIRNKGVRPEFLPEDVWKRWLEVWSDPEYIRMSEQKKLNRRRGEDGPAEGCHTGGSAPYLKHRQILAKQLGRDPTPHELFVHTHTKKHDGRSFVVERAKEVHERVESIREQMTQNSSTVDEPQVFYEATGGKQRSRVYGLGSEGKDFYKTSFTPRVSTFPSKNQSAELKQQLQQLQQQQHATEERHEERYNVLLETIQKQTEIIHAMQQQIKTTPVSAPADVPPLLPARTNPKYKAKLRSKK